MASRFIFKKLHDLFSVRCLAHGWKALQEYAAIPLGNQPAVTNHQYATVIDIDEAQLPNADTVNTWSGEQYARALRHSQADPLYNLHLRQLLHVGYKVAAQMGNRYYGALNKYESDVARNVTTNLWERHIKPLFL